MKLLVIDTSMNACTVAVWANNTLTSDTQTMARGQSERLMPMIMEVVKQAGLTLPDIDLYAATVGPGTFTGIRVGLSTIRALAQISGKPVRAISTFDAVLSSTHASPINACVLLETKRADFYMRTPTNIHSCISAESLHESINKDWVIIGDANVRFNAETGLQNQTIDVMHPTAQSLVNCALQAKESEFLLPLYLRNADVSRSRQKTAIIN